MYGGGVNTYCLVRPDKTYNESFYLYKEYMMSHDIKVFLDYIERTKNAFTFQRDSYIVLQKDTIYTDVHIPDRVTIDLNGYKFECETLDNVGAHVKIISSS